MNILLFSDVPPCTNYSAGIVLEKLCNFLLDQGHQVNSFAVKKREVTPEIPERLKRQMKFREAEKPEENWGGGWRSYVMNGLMARTRLPRITEQAAAFAKETGAEMLWIAEQGQSIILQARPLAKATGLPYVIQTWDSPEWWMQANCYDEKTKAKVMQEYGAALHEAECFIAASWNMEREFKEKYQCKRAKAVVLGLPVEELPPVERDPEKIVIAMAGQIYATKEFEALVKALDAMQWRFGGQAIFLDMYVRYLPHLDLEAPLPPNIRLKGWRVQSELQYELKKADLLYCPYWFDESYKIVAHTSFPNKLCTYLSVGVPAVVHAPEYSSIAQFAKEHNAAYVIGTNDQAGVQRALERILGDPHREDMARRGLAALKRCLTDDVMYRDFFDALGIPLDEAKMSRRVERPLHVVHINNVDLLGNRFNGYEMMRACSEMPDVRMKQIVLDKMSGSPDVISLTTGKAEEEMRSLCTRFEEWDSSRALVQPFGDLIRETRAYKEADVVHYHLVHNGVLSLMDLAEMTHERPSVLTVHDPWLLTGHCIHPRDCQKWKTGCGGCEHLPRDFAMRRDRTAMMWQIRKKLMESSDLELIVASKWMEDMVKASPITASVKHVHRIPFGIDLNLFTGMEQDDAGLRRKHLVPQDAFVLMFRQDLSEYKGMDYILKAIDYLPAELRKKLVLQTVGATGNLEEVKEKVWQVIEHPWVTDNKEIAELYRCCDVFLMPSTAESFGMMALEALASGKPIISFISTAVAEVTHAPDVGLAVPMGDAKALAAAIEGLWRNPEERLRRGQAGRQLAEAEYQFKDYVRRHLELYRELAQRHRRLDV